MRVGVGYSDVTDSSVAGMQAVQGAIEQAGRQDPCDIIFLFATAKHDQIDLRAGVVSAAGTSALIYGGGAVGIITNDCFGYAGDQVGVACIWLDGLEFNAFIDDGLLESEEETGIRLGKRLAAHGVTPDSSVMLFYDAINQSQGGVYLLMATWLLAGLEKGLGFLPDLTGAGLQADHISTPTKQFIGDSISEFCAMAFAFSDEMRIDSVVMHGCRPASPYYTVTKADGPVILEINGKPAIEFMDGILGSALKPQQYPFFLLFGINHGERWAEYDEDNYANRLCLALDEKRGGIVMFEPDMVEGTEFQLMFRSFNFDYIQPKIKALFNQPDGSEPVFAAYIDCAGRCAGYGGVDIEDAIVVQKAVGSRVPLLGIYSGVEIASIGGRPRGLDWTGVFCLFSYTKSAKSTKGLKVWRQEKRKDESGDIPIEGALRIAEQNAAKILELDAQLIDIRHELEEKRRGFKLLAELSVSLHQNSDYRDALVMIARRLNSALNMQKTVVLAFTAERMFVPVVLHGYSEEEKSQLVGRSIRIDPDILKNTIRVTGDNANQLPELTGTLRLPYFISSPIIVRNELAGVLITGRKVEQPPFFSRLSRTSAETVQAISAFLASLLVYQQLDEANEKAQTDALTGLYNRWAFESRVENFLFGCHDDQRLHAFMVIDFDFFKQINDNYGHLCGDNALKSLADALRANFRSTDIIARVGGDEFAVFCGDIGSIERVQRLVSELMNSWRSADLMAENGATFRGTLSIGLSIAPRDGLSYDELFNKADVAMYSSKHQGRNRHTIYNAKTMETA